MTTKDFDKIKNEHAKMLEFITHVMDTMPNGSSLQEKARQLIKEGTEI